MATTTSKPSKPKKPKAPKSTPKTVTDLAVLQSDVATSKPSKPKKPQTPKTATDLATLQSDLATFASSLGLAASSSNPSSGFDDSDFRKSGPLNPKPENPNQNPKPQNPKKNPHPLELNNPFTTTSDSSNITKYPLLKPSALSSSQWYTDAAELESKVLSSNSNNITNNNNRNGISFGMVEKKKEVAERLLEQYVKDYEEARKKRGDMKLLEMSARSGTSSDKVSAFTCLVEDNPIANVKALDGLLCKF